MPAVRRSMAFGLVALLAFSAVAQASHDTMPTPTPTPTPCKSPIPTSSPCKSPSPSPCASPSPVCKPSPKPSPVCASPPPPVCASPPPPVCKSPPPPVCASPPPPVCKPSPSPCASPSPSPCASPSPSPCKSPSPSPSPCASPSPSPCASPSPSPCKTPSPAPCDKSPSPSPSDKSPVHPVHPSPTPVPEPPKCPSVYDLLVTTPSLSVLKAAVDQSGLAAALKDRAFVGTIFAPTNYAISTCWQTGCMNQNTILYHAIIGGSYSALSLFKFGNPVNYFMGNGGIATMRLNQITKGVTITTPRNNATVIVPNVAFCGGYVHVIDTVLDPRPTNILPPSPPQNPTCRPTAYDTIASYPQMAGFKALLDRTGRAALLQNDFFGTIFAPIVTWVGTPGTNEALSVDNHLIMDDVLSYPNQLAGQTLTARSGLKLTVVSQTNLVYNGTSPTPVNLRLTTADGHWADFLNPGFVNIKACGYTIHFVSIPLWNTLQTIG